MSVLLISSLNMPDLGSAPRWTAETVPSRRVWCARCSWMTRQQLCIDRLWFGALFRVLLVIFCELASQLIPSAKDISSRANARFNVPFPWMYFFAYFNMSVWKLLKPKGLCMDLFKRRLCCGLICRLVSLYHGLRHAVGPSAPI